MRGGARTDGIMHSNTPTVEPKKPQLQAAAVSGHLARRRRQFILPAQQHQQKWDFH
jgi:hypothetical protein